MKESQSESHKFDAVMRNALVLQGRLKGLPSLHGGTQE